MIFKQVVDDPFEFGKIDQYVCSCCKGIQPRGKKNKGICHYCKRR